MHKSCFILDACICAYTVIKVKRLAEDDVNKGYAFPDEDDDLTDYKGKHAQLMIPSNLLRNISSKYECKTFALVL